MSIETFNATTYVADSPMDAPLYTSAVVFPILAFIAWIVCLPPMIWHFQQSNVAMGSFVLWIILQDFFNAINPLIWPRDNLLEWWDGSIWCDIQARLQVGCGLGLAASAALIVRKLARVMDTSKITVSNSQSSKAKERIWELVWCWGAPLLLMILYYVVQPVRYMLYGIVGCVSTYDTSWPSIVVVFMWAPIAMCFAAYWAVLLIYRLYRYRRDFQRLVTARNSTRSRFIRLFILSMVVILVYLVYSIYLLVQLCLVVKDPYSWSSVHDPIKFNTIMRIPVHGKVEMDKWIQVATGYVIFALFGTGVDAHNLYKRMLVSIGAGKIWPSLHAQSERRSRKPTSFIAAHSWTSNMSSKAKSMLSSSKSEPNRDTFSTPTRNNSLVLDNISPHLHNTSTLDTLPIQEQSESPPSIRPSFFKRWFATPELRGPLLPFFSHRNFTRITRTGPHTSVPISSSFSPPGVHAQAWVVAQEIPSARPSDDAGVHVMHEVHQSHHKRRSEKDGGFINALV